MAQPHRKTQICVLLLFGVFVAGTVGFMGAERLSPIDAAYFAVVTMSTVGYGDISPATPAGKLVSVLFILCGVGSFMALIGSATGDLLNGRDRRVRRDKCHMLTGLFFSEIGNELLELVGRFASRDGDLPDDLAEKDTWGEGELAAVAAWLSRQTVSVAADPDDLSALRAFLESKTTLLLRLLENPALLENESFTEVLRAVFHLREELAHRDDLSRLHDADREHLGGDMARAYSLTAPVWVEHMRYLREHYPYLFSLAVRTNPFDGRPTASVHGE